jgi:hypothetical protein
MKWNPLPLKCAAALLLCMTACTSTQHRETQSDAAVTEVHPQADPESRATADREMRRREQALRDAERLIEEGDRMKSAGDNEAAIQAYQKSLKHLP